MPVGTRGAIKYLSADDYAALGAQIVLGNTYHLMLRPAPRRVARFGGLGPFAGWDGLTLTDSGGFQVFSLDRRSTTTASRSVSTYDGSTHRFTPESAVAAVQELLGADIQMVLDVCPPLPSPPEVVRLAVDRTSGLGRAGQRRAHRRPDQASVRHRPGRASTPTCAPRAHAHRRARVRRVRHRRPVGGGDPRGDAAGPRRGDRTPPGRSAPLPDGRRRPGLDGGGGGPRRRPVRLRDADPPRPPRHGAHESRGGAREGRNGTPRATNRSIRRAPARCAPAHSRGYLRHLFKVGEPTAARLVSIHNVAWTLS
jgi:queuine tRNA-ribosyltransferase